MHIGHRYWQVFEETLNRVRALYRSGEGIKETGGRVYEGK
jgi:hypothetical protein